MATLALSAVGAAVGGALLPGVGLFGAAIGQAAGAFAGAAIDQALFGASGRARVVEGPRLADLQVMTSSEGASIPRVYGRVRLAGEVIWATRFEEEIVRTSEQTQSGGKGLGGGGSSAGGVTRIEYRYFANFAVGLCEGPITRLGRVWADGKEVDLAGFTYRVHLGAEDALADSLIVAKEGAAAAPAYRGLAIVVFERMPLARFGNRLPQLSFELYRAVDSFEETVRAVTIIPGAGEFVYAQDEVRRSDGPGRGVAENVHTNAGGSDWQVSIDDLQAGLPNLQRAALVVSWFGTDLRADQCAIKPGVESTTKVTSPLTWSVAGLARADARAVSTYEGRPAYGGTPSDETVVAAIGDLTARGLAVTFNPFVLMDVPAGNGLPDPYGGPEQTAFPWRGRITVSPAPGRPGTPDKTAAAAAAVAAFIGTAGPAHFSLAGTTVVYAGPDEWSYRRFVLHNAFLCLAAGGVDAFLIGSELRGLTTIRSSASAFPFVAALVALAADVKSVLGPAAKVSYAADWSEYFGHQPQDGTGDVFFHLDPLWSSPSIDAVAIDAYFPLADWRDGESHLDRLAGFASAHELAYLKTNILGGEGYDWYYGSEADRAAQVRTPITDGIGKPWVFRPKDIRGWWQNAHYDRPGGAESPTPTAWVAQSKPIWLTEVGGPAVDKGANQPNVFVDAKSAESALPYFSRGNRDDLIQRRLIEAICRFYDPADPDYVDGSNPVSTLDDARMVDPARITAYAWDARPFPAFPQQTGVWADGINWALGHWLTGRVASGTVAAIVAAILDDFGFTDYTLDGIAGSLDGYIVDRIMSARAALQPLELAFAIDSLESAGVIRFTQRGRRGSVATLQPADLVETSADDELYRIERRQETELPARTKITFIDGDHGYRQAAVEAQRLTSGSTRVSSAALPMVMPPTLAAEIAESFLRDAVSAREEARFTLPPSRLAIEPTDVVTLAADGFSQRYRVTALSSGLAQEIEATAIEPSIFEGSGGPTRPVPGTPPEIHGPALVAFLDLPALGAPEEAHKGYLAAFSEPWPGGVAFYRTSGDSGYRLDSVATGKATMGTTLTPLPAGVTSRFDLADTLDVVLAGGALQSVTDPQLLGGANVACVENADGDWEVLQFQSAALIGTRTYRLSRLLRGQGGSEGAMRSALAAGARFVLLDAALVATETTVDDIGLAYTWSYGPANRPLGHGAFRTEVHAIRGVGLKPLSPVHVRGRRTGGTVEISWVRRTRVGGDSWDLVEVPLGEASEAYAVDILDGATLKRTIATSAPSATYGPAEQIADFGSAQPAYSIRVCQLSASAGRGTQRQATV